jgi:hypothetical protein
MRIIANISNKIKNLLDETSKEITNKFEKKIIIHKKPNHAILLPEINCIIHNIKESISRG